MDNLKSWKADAFLEVSGGHKLALYRRGNPEGPAVIYCHGGPGGHITEDCFSFFNLEHWNVIAFDQRGCGLSTPFASLEENNIFKLIDDMEAIRQFFGVENWIVFGGSFGSTLALTYAIHHPERVLALILRGIFLGRDADIRWLYQEGASYFFPENFEKYAGLLPQEKRDDIVAAYYEIFRGSDEALKRRAAKAWASWEMGLVRLDPPAVDFTGEASEEDISLAMLECHYFANHMHWPEDNYILNHSEALADIPCRIVHGRYDVDCRPSAAFEIARCFKNVQLIYPPRSGHSSWEPDTAEVLKSYMKEMEAVFA